MASVNMVEFLHVIRLQKRNRTNFYSVMHLMCTIWKNWNISIQRLDIVQNSLWVSSQLDTKYYAWRLLKYLKYFDFSSTQYIIWEYLDILTHNIMHKYLIQLKKLYELYQILLYDDLGHNFSIPPEQNVLQGAKCSNTPNFYTTVNIIV